MAEYIDRDALVRQIICNIAEYVGAPDDVLKHDEQCNYAINMIEDAPAADVAPVVRCKDCKYWQDNNDGYPHEECRWGHGETPDANDFCSHGERKDGDDDAKEN